MTRLLVAGATAALLLAGCGGPPDVRQTGAGPQLPAIDQTLVPTIKVLSPTGWNGGTPTVPAGYRIAPFATDLKVPRQMLVLPNGDLVVAEGKGGTDEPTLRPKDFIAGYIKSIGTTSVKGGDRLTLLRDADGDGKPELRSVLIDRLDAPYGLALVGSELFVAEQGALLRFPYQTGQTQIARTAGTLVAKLPSRVNHHWTKSLAASADGSKLYVGIGSNSNITERGLAVEEDRARIWEIDRATGEHRAYATGVRNPTALAINPWNQGLWAVANERDEIGPRLVPDYLTSVRPGAFYGWPWSYYGQHVDPRVRPQNPAMVAIAQAPDYALGSHVAALGLAFSNGGAFGDGAFVGQHGSWNRSDPAGYKVVFVPFAGGRPAGQPRDVVTGFLADGKARGRPVGVAIDPRRPALFVADHLSNTVWRVTPAAAPTRVASR